MIFCWLLIRLVRKDLSGKNQVSTVVYEVVKKTISTLFWSHFFPDIRAGIIPARFLFFHDIYCKICNIPRLPFLKMRNIIIVSRVHVRIVGLVRRFCLKLRKPFSSNQRKDLLVDILQTQNRRGK